MITLNYNLGTDTRAFSTMRGGGSGNYDGFNITHYCGDTPEHVAKCREELCSMLKIPDTHLIVPRQTHGCKVLEIGKEFMEANREERMQLLEGVDAVMTSLPGVCIGVSTADCIPLLLHDTRKRVIAAIHAGWRGTVARIAVECIRKMQEIHGCSAADIRAVIAPGISIDAFEIGDEVYRAFEEAGFDMQRISKRYPTRNGAEKWHIDLWEANRLQLTATGVPAGNIHTTGICTYSSHEEFFSARRLGINSGRIFNGIMLEKAK